MGPKFIDISYLAMLPVLYPVLYPVPSVTQVLHSLSTCLVHGAAESTVHVSIVYFTTTPQNFHTIPTSYANYAHDKTYTYIKSTK